MSLDVTQPGIAALIAYVPSTLGTAAVVNIGSTTGLVPAVPIPLSCMDLTVVAPIVFDPTGKTIGLSFGGTTLQYVRGDGTLATLPSIPAGQVNSDWSASSGLAQILNKPTLGTAAATNSGAYDASGAAASAQAASQPLALILTNLGAQSGTTGLPRKTGAATWTLDTSTFLTGNQTLTLSGDVTGSGATAITVTLKNTGTAATYTGVTTDAQGRVTAGTSQVVNNTPTVPLVTAAAAANGTQVSATQSALVSYSVTTSSTSTIAGASSVVAVLEICPTNSATAANWLTIATVQNGQTLTLAVALQAVQTLSQGLAGVVPAGYYRRIRYTVTGTGSATFASGQEVLN